MFYSKNQHKKTKYFHYLQLVYKELNKLLNNKEFTIIKNQINSNNPIYLEIIKLKENILKTYKFHIMLIKQNFYINYSSAIIGLLSRILSILLYIINDNNINNINMDNDEDLGCVIKR